jgi:iron complex outermembrane receptor protein
MALFGSNGALRAQTVQPPGEGAPAAQANSDQPTNKSELQEVVVTGIRYALQQSLAQKRASTDVVEVITAEDIGKMPDKNVADALQRLPGVNISSAGATEGGFDEADRVSMRGTNPSYTQTLIDGHNVASADWFVLDQTGTVGRSVSYTLLPSEIVSKVVVEKSSEASLIEGGVAGSIDIVTRKPLDFHDQTTLQATAGAVYADLPGKTSPQFNALGNWVNDAHDFGVLIQVFAEDRYLERQGQELLGYGTIAPGSKIATADPNLTNVAYPLLIGSALFQQERDRNGGLMNIQWQANDNLMFDASGFLSKLEATNLNDNYLFWGTNIFNGGNGQAPNPGYTVQNGTLTSATFAPVAGTAYGVYDQISRPDESATSNFGNLDIHWKASDALSFLGQLGVSTGHGRTPTQDVSETTPGVGSGAQYTLNGTTSAANWNLGNTINTSPTPGGVPVAFSWIFGDQNMDVVDKEVWEKIDGTFAIDSSVFTDFKFGVRYTDHERHLWGAIGQGPGCDGEPCPANATPAQTPSNPANYPTGFLNYPTAFGSGIGSGFPTGIWYWSPAQLAAYDQSYTNRDPISRADWTADYGLEEKDAALYVQTDFKSGNLTGNFGLRGVQTKESVIGDVGVTAQTPGAITTSAFGPYIQQTTDNTYNNLLPSLNLKLDITPELVGRFAAAQTMTRPDYSALADSTSLGAPPPPGQVGSGTGSNANLRPIKATDLDTGLEWYFQPKAILAADVFYMYLHDYIGYGSQFKTFQTFTGANPNGYPAVYDLTVPINADGRVYGAEFEYEQVFFDHWGISTNYTYADGLQTSGLQTTALTVPGGTDDRLVGTSKDTFNLIVFYENDKFNARIAYNYRSAFYDGLDRSTAYTQNGIGSLAASLGYTVSDHFSITLDGLNLNNPELKYYALNTDQPRAFYKNGSQYYLNLHFKM